MIGRAAGALVLLAAGCAAPSAGDVLPGALGREALLRALSPPRDYEGQKAAEVIDGALAVFEEFGFRRLRVAEYPAGTGKVIAEVYEMADPAAAFGIYAQGRDPEGEFVPLGHQGWIFRERAEFWEDRFFVRLSGRKGAARGDVLSVGTLVAARIPDRAPAYPAVLARLHLRETVPNSAKYFRGSLAFERSCPELSGEVSKAAGSFEGFSVGHSLGRVFLLQCATPEGALAARGAILAEWSPQRKEPPPPGAPEPVGRKEGDREEHGAIAVHARQVWGVVGAARPEGLMDFVQDLWWHLYPAPPR